MTPRTGSFWPGYAEQTADWELPDAVRSSIVAVGLRSARRRVYLGAFF
ncbi:hypothetical protein [Nocardia sp. NRRL S-836]|nr:hypothetical protein [Nocardia sp. NRRL S-836]